MDNKVIPQRRNANKHSQRGLAALDTSIHTDGWMGAITTAADGETFDGSARLETLAEAMPQSEPIFVDIDGTRPVILRRTDIPDANDPRAKRLAVAANAIASMDWTPDGELLAVLAEEDAAIKKLIEQDDKALEAVRKYAQAAGNGDAEPQVDRAAELQVKWQTATGQLWRIGEHRLLCGDSTKREDVERVMGGEKADACVTDSPYGINREGIENDDPEGLRKLFDGVLSCMPIENGVIINFQSPRLFPVWLDAVRMINGKIERALWFYDETDVTFPWRGWLMTSQIAIVSSIGKAKWPEDKVYHHDCYMVTTAGKQEGTGGHTTAKPLDIILDLVTHTLGDVYEPFAGSGTTLVACQNLNRKCRAVEISPNYTAVILERMATAFPELVIEQL